MKLFNFNYPVLSTEYKQELERKIIRHFYMEEIAFETPALFMFYLQNKIQEIMPYYNKIAQTEMMEINPLDDVFMTKEIIREAIESDEGTSKTDIENTGNNTNKVSNYVTSSGKTETDGNRWNKFQDTPQGKLEDIEAGRYLTSATNDTDTGSIDAKSKERTTHSEKNANANEMKSVGERENTKNTSENINEVLHGRRGLRSYGLIMKQYREVIINTQLAIIDELKPLFMPIY